MRNARWAVIEAGCVECAGSGPEEGFFRLVSVHTSREDAVQARNADVPERAGSDAETVIAGDRAVGVIELPG